MLQPRNTLEKEIAAVLKGSAHVLERKNKELTEDEEKALQQLDLEEVSYHVMLFHQIFCCSIAVNKVFKSLVSEYLLVSL